MMSCLKVKIIQRNKLFRLISCQMLNHQVRATFSKSLPYSSLHVFILSTFQFSSVAQLCPTLCDPMNSSTPGLPVHHQLPEFTQTHVRRVGYAIQLSYPLSSPSPPAPVSQKKINLNSDRLCLLPFSANYYPSESELVMFFNLNHNFFICEII